MVRFLSTLNNPYMAGIFALLTVLGVLFLLHKNRLLRDWQTLLLVLALAIGAALLRTIPLDYRSNDYEAFLSKWVDFFRDNGGFFALKERIGDYNFPYLYFLALFSYIPLDDLYLIKFLSIAFDLLTALYAMRLVSLFHKNQLLQLASFFIILYLPTLWINSSLWAQCDSIYTAFGLMGLYYGLNGRPCLSMISTALAFSFKLQIVFLLPIYLVFLFAGKIRFRHLWLFPLTYFATVLPALLLGRPVLDVFKIYTNQVGTYSAYLTLNAPSIYAWMPMSEKASIFASAGILTAFALLTFLFFLSFIFRTRLNSRIILWMAIFMTIAIPFLLPSMHERYFYLADVLTVVFALILPRRFIVPLLTQYGSWTGYSNYLLGGGTGIKSGALAILAAGLLVGQELIKELTILYHDVIINQSKQPEEDPQ